MNLNRRSVVTAILAMLLLVMPVLAACSPAPAAPAAPTAAPAAPQAAPTAAPAAPAPATAVPAAAAPTAASAAPAASTGGFKGVIKLFESPPLTGPAALALASLWRGVQLWERYINEKGGINGYQVQILGTDSGFDPARTVTLYKRALGETPKPGLVVIMDSRVGEALKAQAEHDKVVVVDAGQSDPQIYPPGWVFIYGTTYVNAFVPWMEWLAKTWKGPGKPKVALVAWEGGAGLQVIGAAKALGPKLGVDVVDSEITPQTVVDATPLVTRFRDKGVNELFGFWQVPTFAAFSQATAKLGLQGKMNLTGLWVADLDGTYALAKEAAEGNRMVSYFPAISDPSPNVKKWLDFYGSVYADKPQGLVMAGFLGHELIGEGLRLALNKVGTPDKLTGPVVKEAFESIKDFEGLLHPKTTLGPDIRTTQPRVRIWETRKGGDVGYVSDWLDSKPLPRGADGNVQWDKYEPPK